MTPNTPANLFSAGRAALGAAVMLVVALSCAAFAAGTVQSGDSDLEGVLLSESDGSPISGAAIYMGREGQERSYHVATTDEHGRFRIHPWDDAKNVLRAHGEDIDGHPRRVLSADDLKAGFIVWKVATLPLGPTVKFQLLLQRGDTRVPFTPQEMGAEADETVDRQLYCLRAKLDPETKTLSKGWDKKNSVIDKDGVCVFKRVPSGRHLVHYVEVYRSKKGESSKVLRYYPVAGALDFTVPDEQDDAQQLEVVLGPERPSITWKGKVVDARDGSPLADASVKIREIASPEPTEDPNRELEIKTGPDGSFQVDVPPSLCGIAVSAEGFVETRLVVYLLPGAETDIQLEPTYSLSGDVIGIDGKPAAGVRIEIQGDHGGSRALSDQNGHFLCPSLRKGTYKVIAQGRGSSIYASEVEINQYATTTTITLPAGATLTGRVTFPDGFEGPERIILFFVDSELSLVEARVDIGPTGEYTATVNAKRLTAFLFFDRGFHRIGEVQVAKDNATADFEVTEEMLTSPSTSPFK